MELKSDPSFVFFLVSKNALIWSFGHNGQEYNNNNDQEYIIYKTDNVHN